LGIEINAIARKEHLGLLPVYTITALAVAIYAIEEGRRKKEEGRRGGYVWGF
jgi:1-aminocyclopropane-1-carboxylate deaminase/D-cysteine desulfhydrase-like pyridoxal-dependent ACC family enzyme